ncbi:putative bifunctional diguanylate cyclase/phosphodiesterase [Pseudemcibacter aquimaris]|uniref:putative bifunctional diguanylate cyclase/phosphodiesterase n=1 Tax=Pseudemcibacter aquimaris TaxID=2857064 RepID=UPI0020111515|nr:EAL domain-containing protein [Pseudemcibacter aquimaris]MCC3862130.1 EAL domain-containing protein [Pseudemcibacter aquimaris]WDU58883.1 EAL domain-containing protein [Pseudemcibacter aquimaris]
MVNCNSIFQEKIQIDNFQSKENPSLYSLMSFELDDAEHTRENINAYELIEEMFKESSSANSFNWVNKFFLKSGELINLKTEFFPDRGLIITLNEIRQTDENQMIEFQAAKDYLESQTQQAIHMAEDLAIAQEEAANSAERIQTILNAMEEGLVTLNLSGKIVSANNAMSVIFGYAPSDFIGMELIDFVKSTQLNSSEDVLALLSEQVDGFNVYKSDEMGKRKDGSEIPLKIDIREVFLEQEKHYTVLFRNVSEQYEAEKLIRHMAWHDSLTGLANRNLLSERLDEALKMARRTDKQVAVMILDLDKFKPVNDLHGHATGDKLLKVVADRLLKCARDIDTVARLGGDEFAIVFTNIEDEKNIITIADRIINSIQQPTDIDGNILQIGTSIGMSFFPQDSDTPVELIRMADVALYQAKEDGRRVYRLYDQQMDAETKAQKQIEMDLNKALENNELLLHYQPQFDAENLKLVGAEALIRWQHPLKGMISPYEFIPIAELCGLMIPIGQWVLNTACIAAKRWQDMGLPKIRICVNISARQFHADNFVDTIVHAIKVSNLNPKWLELEITEGMVIKNADSVVTKLEGLKALGVYLSIDDFGTGYSSLAYLKRFPVNKLKIDQSFIRNIHEDHDDAAITDAVIRLGHSLGLSVVAEGVETEEHVEILRQKECDVFQGYHFCRPIEHDEFVKFQKKQAKKK